MNWANWLLIVVIIVALIVLTPNVEDGAPNVEDGWIVISPMWGLCNRLRTLRVAHDLAKALNRRLAVVDVAQDEEFKSMFNGRLRDLFVSRWLTFLDVVPQHQATRFTHNEDCTLRTTLKEMQSVRSKYIVIRACGLTVDGGLTETNEFYQSLVPTALSTARMAQALSQITPNTIGVHIRQGNISDYRKGNFFGAWKQHQDPTKLPIECCDNGDNSDKVCPNNAPRIEQFIEKMKAENAVNGTSTFFVCSDRPGCYNVLRQTFPGQIINNPVEIEYDAKALNAFCDWYCLAKCNQIIVTSISSFSGEAAKMNGAKVITLT